MSNAPPMRLGPDDGGNFEYHWSNHYFQAHLISDVGKKREFNEDSCVMCAPEEDFVARERGLLFGVADGMGGASAGEHASRLTLTTIVQQYYRGRSLTVPAQLMDSVERANERVFQEAAANPQYHGMGTTVCAMLVTDDCAYVAHVGDSRLYITRGSGVAFQVTNDHSLVAEQVRSGIISEEEARTHSMKNLITRAVGIKESVEIDMLSFRVRRGDTILICSDGLSNMVPDEEISASMHMDNVQAAARLLVGKALEGGGSDNISVALVRVAESPPKAALQEGCQAVSIPANGLFGKLRRFVN